MPSIVDLAEISNAVYNHGTSLVTVTPPVTITPAGNPFAQRASSQAPRALLPQAAACLLDPPPAAPTPKTWRKVQFAHNRAGFYAGLYECGNQRVIAFRGTDDLLDALVDDAAVGAGMLPPQVIAAFQTASAWGVSGNTYLTGHSLGGALAVLAACHFNLPAVTFNAPGVADVCVQIEATSNALSSMLAAVSRCVRNSRVRNLRIAGDPVSSYFTTGFQAGGNVTAFSGGSCGLDLLCLHGMATCLAAVRESVENYQELTL